MQPNRAKKKKTSRARTSRRVTNYGKRSAIKKRSENGETKGAKTPDETIIPKWEDIPEAQQAYTLVLATQLSNVKGFIDSEPFRTKFADTPEGIAVLKGLAELASKYTTRMTSLSQAFTVTRTGVVKGKHMSKYINLYSAWADLSEEMRNALGELLVVVTELLGKAIDEEEQDGKEEQTPAEEA